MRRFTDKILLVVLSMVAPLISNDTAAHEQTQVDQPAGIKQELTVAAPDLHDIIPLAARLSGRLAALEIKLNNAVDISGFEKKYAGMASNIRDSAGQLLLLKDSQDYSYPKLVELKEKIEQEGKLFEDITSPVSEAIRQLGALRAEWLAEKNRWNEWRLSLPKEGTLDQLESTFIRANATIDDALNLILPQLETALMVQEKAADIQAKIDAVAYELDSLIQAGRHDFLLEQFPPMFSPHYFSQFGIELWYMVQKRLKEISWPGSQFYSSHGWAVFTQALISLIVIIAIFRNREELNDSKRGQFLAARPFSAGFFTGIMVTLVFYEYAGVPYLWKLAYTLVGGISFARLMAALVDAVWKRQLVYGVMIVLLPPDYCMWSTCRFRFFVYTCF
jgi:hypothetical protein